MAIPSDNGFQQVTFEQVARAVNHVSHWLQERFEIGEKPPRHTTLSYIGVPDLRYNILFYAAVQCRYKVFLPSPRNPTAVNISLLEQTECVRLVHSLEVASVAKTLQAAISGLECQQFLSLEELLGCPAMNYEYSLKYADVYREPILILHSSGSTGQPKPVVSTHGTFATYVSDWPTVPGRVNHDVINILEFSEPDNSSAIRSDRTNFGPPLRPPSGTLAADILRIHNPRGAIIPPSIMEQLYHEPGGIDLLKRLDVILFAGGPLPQVVGDEISKHTTLCQFYGSTEMNQIHQLVPIPEDWAYIHFHPNERLELQPAGEGMFELVVFADKDLERTSPLYHNYPDVREWRTKDLFKPHPIKPDLWKFHARRDDILVFSSGEKLNPIPMESSITAVPSVSGALVIGQGQPQAALLIEVAQVGVFSSEDLWPAVEAANSLLPGHGRIARSMILIADAGKPFVRAGKGTVVRRLTEELFAFEIQKLYETVSSKLQPAPLPVKFPFLDSDISGLVSSILGQVSIAHMTDEDNFYAHGMDSVKTVEAVGLLKASLLPYKSEADLNWISAETLYRNPTIRQLSSILFEFLSNGTIPKKRDRIAEMQTKISEYTLDLPQSLASLETKEQVAMFSVAITGTTGYLGGRLLAELIKNPRISQIYCLNRSTKARQIFQKENSWSSPNVLFFHVNLASPDLGLSEEEYTQLLQNCNIIIHNAWRVDFNLDLDSFSDNLQSIKHLISLSAASVLRPRIIFISSISSTGVFASAGSPQYTVAEDIVEDLGATMDIGYAESKHMAEHILHAASKVHIPATIVRMGQISPSSASEEQGKWPDGDLVPIFLRTCKAAKLLALDFVDTLNWVPVNQAARIVADIMDNEVLDSGYGLRVYNVVHPRPRPWNEVMDTLMKWCGEETQIVTLQEWVMRLKELDASDPQMLDKFPALLMLKIFDIMAQRGPTHKYGMKNLLAVSRSLVQLPGIDAEMMELWLEQLSA